MFKKKSEKCIFCGSSTLLKYCEAVYWNYADLNFERCNECGLIFCNPMPDEETIRKGNNALNIVHTSRGTVSQYRGGKEFSLFLRKIKRSGIFLDVGCAEGFFLKGIKDFSDWKVEGIDIVDTAIQFGNDVLNVQIHNCFLEQLNRKEYYDFLRMNNVIEHIQNPFTFLKKANELLKEKGIIWCSAPNGIQEGALFRRANAIGIKLNILENHFIMYDPMTLQKIFINSGFKILKHYCEDIKNSAKDFGLLPWHKPKNLLDNYYLKDYINKKNENFQLSKNDIESMYHDNSLKNYKIVINLFIKKYLRIKLPAKLKIGHQQLIIAKK